MVIGIIVSFALGMLLSGIWFGLVIALERISDKCKLYSISRVKSVIAAVIPTYIILKLNNHYFFNVKSVSDWKAWIEILGVAIITAFIVSKNEVETLPSGKELLWYGIDGIFMEIPQRLMMQSFVWCILKQFKIDNAIVFSIFINAMIWCSSIIIQNMIFKIKFEKSTVREIFSSFFFSVGAGYILIKTEFIIFTMIAHLVERIVSTRIRGKMHEK